MFYAKAFRQDVGKAVDIVSDILQNSKLDASAIERERDAVSYTHLTLPTICSV